MPAHAEEKARQAAESAAHKTNVLYRWGRRFLNSGRVEGAVDNAKAYADTVQDALNPGQVLRGQGNIQRRARVKQQAANRPETPVSPSGRNQPSGALWEQYVQGGEFNNNTTPTPAAPTPAALAPAQEATEKVTKEVGEKAARGGSWRRRLLGAGLIGGTAFASNRLGQAQGRDQILYPQSPYEVGSFPSSTAYNIR